MKKNQKGRHYRRFFTAAGSKYYFIISFKIYPLKMRKLAIAVSNLVAGLLKNSHFDKIPALFYHFCIHLGMKITDSFATSNTREKSIFLLEGLNKEKALMAFSSRAVLLRYLQNQGGLIYIHKAKKPQELTNYLKLNRELHKFPVMHITLVPPGATLISHNESYMIYKLPLIKTL